MLAKNATVDPVRMAQQYAVGFKKQLKNVDRESYTESNAPIPVRISARPVSGGPVPASSTGEQAVKLATFKSLMDELNMQIKEINAIEDKVGSAVLLVVCHDAFGSAAMFWFASTYNTFVGLKTITQSDSYRDRNLSLYVAQDELSLKCGGALDNGRLICCRQQLNGNQSLILAYWSCYMSCLAHSLQMLMTLCCMLNLKTFAMKRLAHQHQTQA